jgi:hypothetical protein
LRASSISFSAAPLPSNPLVATFLFSSVL